MAPGFVPYKNSSRLSFSEIPMSSSCCSVTLTIDQTPVSHVPGWIDIVGQGSLSGHFQII
jgi:hypothetical protein